MRTYRIAPGVDAVPLGDDGLLFRSSTLAVKLEGSAAAVFRNQLVPQWSQALTAEDLAGLAGVDLGALTDILDSLVRSQVLISSSAARTETLPLDALAESLRLDAVEVRTRLSKARVVVVGLEGHGAALAEELCRSGVGSLLLADPFPLRADDRFLLPPLSAADGTARQSAVGDALRARYPATAISCATVLLNRQSVEELARECTALAGCFDRGFEQAQHWVNRAAIGTNTPALFVEVGARNFMVGPFVVPGESACYMCYRMRRLACEADYTEAMAHETFLNQGTAPRLGPRAIAPFAASVAAGLAAGELVKSIALLLPPSLASQVLEFDSFTLEQRRHAVLRHPDCPVCAQKKKKLPPNPPLDELEAYARTNPSGDLLAEFPRLVSSRTGVVMHVEAFVKDASEPAVPYVFRADVSNRRFQPNQKDDPDVCSGKGLTVEAAKISAIGEAVERYSGASFSQEDVTISRRSELGSRSIDPRDLVLFDPSQYESLPYAPYDDNRLGWVAGRSISDGGEVLVPAIAAFMSYSVHASEEFLAPITSNGLAAGRTLPDAILSAAGEVLERDAFLLTWFHRLPTRRFSPLHHPDSNVVSIARAYARRGVELRLHQLLPENPLSTFACLALESGSRGPSVVIGLGADLDPVRAARQAVLEVCQVRPALRKRMRRPETQKRLLELLADPREVRTIDDHDLLYASPASRSKLEFLLDVTESPFSLESPQEESPVARLARLAAWLEEEASDLIYVNLTPSDMQSLGFYTVRAILPRFQPIDFGWAERRLGGTRLYDYPLKTGLRPVRATIADLNPDPHPLA